MGSPVIATEALTKNYDTGDQSVQVLHGIDLRIDEGEFVAIMGPSGSGKSTLMNILGCLDTPTSGRYLLDGRDVSDLDDDELADVRNKYLGFVFQGFNLLKRVTAIDNVALPLLYSGSTRAQRRERAAALLEQLGLVHQTYSYPNQLSGGQQQRVAIARALANHPKLMLADEPTGNLDTQTSQEIMAVFEELNREQGMTIVLVTHEPDIAHHAQRLVQVRDGLVVYDGPPAGLL